LLANDQEAAAHEEVLKQLDKASGGKTLWRIQTAPAPVA
jgi:DNA polymerase-3 subunit epsilon